MTDRPTDSDLTAFLEAVSGVKPIKQDKIQLKPRASKPKTPKVDIQRNQAQAEFFFSDQFQAHFPDEGPLRWRREDVDSHRLKQLRRGDFQPALLLDLHGLTRENAKREIAALLLAARKQQAECVSIMHGFGTHTLKQAVPNWLVQHPLVQALHQAPHEWGGKAAILVLLDIIT